MGALVLLLVLAMLKRPSNPLQAYVGGKPVNVALVVIDDKGHLLRRDAADAFTQMRAAAAAGGVQLVVESAFRTFDQQAALYNAYTSGQRTDVAAPPVWSNHQGGTALDLVTERGTNAAYAWLVANAHLYGFKRTVPSEPWHWEFL